MSKQFEGTRINMPKQFKVGKWYEVQDASLHPDLEEVLSTGEMALPAKFECTTVDDDGYCRSTTEGVLWLGSPLNGLGEAIMVATTLSLNSGAVVETEAPDGI